MENELVKAIKSIDSSKLTENDKDNLLRIFMAVNEPAILNQIAFKFSDCRFHKAVPSIFEKINSPALSKCNGSLVWALADLDLKDHFIPLIGIICEQEYEPRLWAYGIVENMIPQISAETRSTALQLLTQHRIRLELTTADQGPESPLHFIESTMQLLHQSY